ncbi:protease HtpX [Buchnera aphidicola (Pemphigus obesinymphae)]|uniref:protease HtpX n=1 Tax=Buchnera aphidicola TaxID=9 RepID=UPI002238E53C|nr:protease HtpX [Buchnera aphidicola]MCW5196621.1 protease HtpX [Buchnera aphidicola (Pemphigus obesinymphae)]
MMRIILFMLTNLSVMFIFGIILSLTGIQSHSIYGLIIISGLFGFGGSIFSLLLSKWIAIRSVNGRIIHYPSNESEIWLTKTVHQQAKKMGLIPPEVAIYDALDMNAFATGPRRNSSLIAVSTGLLNNMTKDEAEAVIAHEISHIANGDMVTMTLVQGVVNTFVIFVSRIIAQLVTSIISGSKDANDFKNGHSAIYLVTYIVLELIFGIFASIITMWFSRYREFHADAGSAKLVGRNKMIAALERFKTSCEPKESSSILAFCINGKNKSIINLFMSHPPLKKRIEALYNNSYL